MNIVKRNTIAICLTFMLVGLTAHLLHLSHLNQTENYVKSSGKIYSWKHYKCFGGVVYSTGQSDTLMVNKDGSPKQCKIVRMTNREYSEL